MDDDEFRKAVADVRPLKAVRRAAPPKPPAPPVALQSLRDERAALIESIERPVTADEALETGEELVYLRDGLSRLVLRRLRRGHWVVQAELDLHGMNRHEAAIGVAVFLLALVGATDRLDSHPSAAASRTHPRDADSIHTRPDGSARYTVEEKYL